ncbi:MAG: hypothetical protein FWC53_03410 [Firmicutes bacterium]|nr:hypothetical protein [Bacillota bacterium]
MKKTMVWEEVLILAVLLAVIGFVFIVNGLKSDTNNIENNTVNVEGE